MAFEKDFLPLIEHIWILFSGSFLPVIEHIWILFSTISIFWNIAERMQIFVLLCTGNPCWEWKIGWFPPRYFG